MKIQQLLRVTLLVLSALITAGCGKKDDAETNAKDKATTQVAAKVNTYEITVHQVNSALARNPNIKPEAAPEAKREILNRLIDQQLAAQQAVEKKLDRNPNVVQALEAARNEILARAYVEQVGGAQLRPSDEEVKKYYAEHPELFAQRRVFSIEEMAVDKKPGLAAALQEQVAKARSLQDVGNWLKSQDVKFAANRGVRSAEQIPLNVLPKLQAMKDGSMQVFGEGDGPFQVIRIVATKPAPVDEATAAPRIQQFLFNRRSSEAVTAEMKRLRDKAEIRYEGEFAEGEAGEKARAKAQAEAQAQAQAKAKSKAEAEALAREEELAKARTDTEARARREAETKTRDTAPKAVQAPQESIDKGVKGLR